MERQDVLTLGSGENGASFFLKLYLFLVENGNYICLLGTT
jgi:hypothetical protein